MAHADQIVLHARREHGVVPSRAEPRDAARMATRNDLALAVTSNLQDLETEWRAFERHADCTVFQSFDWLSTWQTCIGARTGVTPAIVSGRRRSGELLFILPLAVQSAGPWRRLTYLARDLCDYNAPLLAPDFSGSPADAGDLWQRIGSLLQRNRAYRHDVVLLDKMPERVGAQANPLLRLAVMANPSGAYLTALSADWDTLYTAKRSSATRRRDRTKRKRLAESGDVRMATPDTSAEIAVTLDALIAQKRRAFARMGVRDIFALPGHADFFAALALGARDLVHVSRLDVGASFAATNLGLVFRGRYYHILASYEDGPLARFGPGAAHLHELMRYAIERGCSHFDFTIGDEPYKRDWCDSEIALHDHIGAATAWGSVQAAALTQTRRLKRFIKQSPTLWRLATRMRALASLKRPVHPGRQAADPTD